jgi:AcrR family transcriptional regulator
VAESKHLHSSGPTTRVGTLDARELLLRAALRVYSTSGVRGATTRRIAQEAGVNEVTLFRQFGSKDALIQEALAFAAEQFLAGATLPDSPSDPDAELLAFSRQYLAALSRSRSLIRTCLGEFDEHPQATRVACQTPIRISEELEVYLAKLRDAGLARGEWDEQVAAAMLMGTLFSDAMGRDCMPERYPFDETEAVRHYVSLFLCAIGVSGSTSSTAGSSTVQE